MSYIGSRRRSKTGVHRSHCCAIGKYKAKKEKHGDTAAKQQGGLFSFFNALTAKAPSKTLTFRNKHRTVASSCSSFVLCRVARASGKSATIFSAEPLSCTPTQAYLSKLYSLCLVNNNRNTGCAGKQNTR